MVPRRYTVRRTLPLVLGAWLFGAALAAHDDGATLGETRDGRVFYRAQRQHVSGKRGLQQALRGSRVVNAPTWTPPNATQLARLDRALATFAASFDPAENMTTAQAANYNPGYGSWITTGTVHPTRESLWYALGLLDTGRNESLPTAFAIVRRVLSLQDTNSSSRTWGTWPWFAEEPIAQMRSPDLNWIDFNGLTLLEMLRDHYARLPADLADAVWTGALTAARASMKRNVGPGYTNVCVLGTYVTLVAGESLGDEALRSYGTNRLIRFYNYTVANGGFTEYNSPPYTAVALQDLSRLRSEVQNATLVPMLDVLVRRAWEEYAYHFHNPTWQWGGPHARSYATLLRRANLALIERGTNDGVSFPGIDIPHRDDRRYTLRCPPDLWSYFGPLTAPRTHISNFIPATNTVGTTFLHFNYTLGSINHGDLWNQRRALIAYFGSSAKTQYLHMRFLKDNYDFASAYLTSVQDGGKVAGAVTFFTNGGNTHVSLDMVQNGTINATDLRLRFELGSSSPNDTVALASISLTNNTAATILVSGLTIRLSVPYASLGGLTGQLSSGYDPVRSVAFVDVVMYSGARRNFTLTSMNEAVIGFVLSMGAEPLDSPSVSVQTSDQAVAGELFVLPSPQPPAALGGTSFLVVSPAGFTSVNSGALTLQAGNLTLTVPTRPLPVSQRVALDSSK